jgi:nitrate reductase NapE component
MARGNRAWRRIADGGLVCAAALLEAIAFAAVIAALVYLWPGSFSVLVLGLYGFICVWMLQAAAVLMALLMLGRAISGAREGWKAVALCAGFIIVIACSNAYILALGHLWGKNFGANVNDVVLSRFLLFDQRAFDFAAAVIVVIGGFLDHLAVTLFHLRQSPLAELVSTVAGWSVTMRSADPVSYTGAIGLLFGFAFSIWRWSARG